MFKTIGKATYKKFVAMILSLAMVFEFAGIDSLKVYAEDKIITEVGLTLAVPVANATPKGDVLFPESADGYDVTGFGWYNITGVDAEGHDITVKMAENEKFVKGKKYKAILNLKCKTGYALPDLNTGERYSEKINVTANGNGEVSVIARTGNDTFMIHVDYVAGEALKSVEFTVEEPVIGEKPQKTFEKVETVPSNAFIDNAWDIWDLSTTWQYSKDGVDWDDMDSKSKFEYGYYYRVNPIALAFIPLFLSYGAETVYNLDVCCGVNNDTDVKINGKMYDLTKSPADQNLAVFEPQTKEVSKCEVKVTAPTDGKTPSYSLKFKGEDKNCFETKLMPGHEYAVEWRLVNNVDAEETTLMNPDDKFEKGKTYRCYVTVGPKYGVNVIGNLEVNINGKKAESTMLAYYRDFEIKDKVTEVKFIIPEPVAGESTNKMTVDSTPEKAFVEKLRTVNTDDSWQVSEDGKTYRKMEKNEVFEEGKYYRTSVVSKFILAMLVFTLTDELILDDAYASEFDSDVKYYVNGELVDFNNVEKVDLDGDGSNDGYYTYFKVEKKENKDDVEVVDGPKEGTIVKDSKLSYSVTKAGSTDGKVIGELEVVGVNSKKAKSVKIASTVTIDGVKYKITSIGKNAFKKNKKNLKKVVIGKNVRIIGKGAFAGCTKLKSVIVKSKKLKKVAKNSFKGVKKSCKITVPKAKKKLYKKLFKRAKCKAKVK